MPELLAVTSVVLGIVFTILWLVIGWRAMRAHERLAQAARDYTDFTIRGDMENLRRENALQHKLYRQFKLEHPDAAALPPKERHEKFRAWLAEHGEPE